ncbi:MAG: sulfotransferase domain-containing protein [Pseudomonadota bacterium]
MLPNFLIIGAPRSGTTWLAMNLREHPEIFMPRIKEVHYFDRHFEEGQGFYEDFFTTATERVIGEATPDYIYYPEVPSRISALIPECKMILCLRNPIDRVYSRYWNSVAKYEENRDLSFEDKLREKPLFIDEGKYYTHLKRYYEHFSPDQFLILDFHEINNEPNAVLRRTYDFLGVAPDFVPETTDLVVNTAAAKPFLAKSKSMYWVHRAFEKVGLHGLANKIQAVNSGELPKMKPETRAWLRDEIYHEENQNLQDLTGLDVSGWT